MLSRFSALLPRLAPLDLYACGPEERFFCTPSGLRVFARLGTDGVHYGILPAEGDGALEHSPVYAVRPMGDPAVVPLAPDFRSFLLLVRSLGGANALDQSADLSRADFLALAAAGSTPEMRAEQSAALRLLEEAFSLPAPLTPEAAYDRLRAFSVSPGLPVLTYSRAYYDALGLKGPAGSSETGPRPSQPASVCGREKEASPC